MDPNEYDLDAIKRLSQNIPTTGNQNPQNHPFYPNPPNNFNNPNHPHYPYPPTNPNMPNHPYYQYPPNNSNMPYGYQYPMYPHPPTINPTMSASGVQYNDKDPETPVGSIHESQDPPFCTQDGLESIDIDVGGGSATQKKSKARERYSSEEDKLLIQSYLNISKDPVVGVDQKAASFWKRVTESYNEYLDKDMGTRELTQLKARWHRLNSAVSKFVGCYKQASESKTSGSSEHDIICNASTIFRQDNGEKFSYEHAWHMLKDEMKWQGGLSQGSSKRTKNSASGAYTSSSNPSTPASVDCNPAMAFLPRPIGQKAAKRKER